MAKDDKKPPEERKDDLAAFEEFLNEVNPDSVFKKLLSDAHNVEQFVKRFAPVIRIGYREFIASGSDEKEATLLTMILILALFHSL